MVEKMSNNNDMSTSKESINWTDSSKDSKLKDILDVLNDFEIKNTIEINSLKSLLRYKEYKAFQHEIGMNNPHGKLGYKSFNFLINYINKIKDTENLRKTQELTLNNLYNKIVNGGKTGNENVDDSIVLKDILSQKKGQTLGDDEYNKLFTGLENVQQTIGPDCYLVCAINELSRVQYFDTLIKTSIKRAKRTSGDLGYIIKIPLGCPSGRSILIKDSEIKNAKIQGNKGYKILEIAYAKYIARPISKDKNYAPMSESEFQKIVGGKTEEALKVFIGKNNIKFTKFGGDLSLKHISSSQKQILESNVIDYNPSIGNKYVSLSSLSYKEAKPKYEVGGKTLYRGHAYILAGVVKNEDGTIRTIQVLNPFNKTGKGNNYLSFTYEEFIQAFRCVAVGKVNIQTFLQS